MESGTGQSDNQRNIIITVVAVLLLCCCCSIFVGIVGWFYGDTILEQFGRALPGVLSA